MLPHPLIGIASNIIPDPKNPGWQYYANREQDVTAVSQAGGIPLLLPPVFKPEDSNTLLDRLDGLYLAGGGDIDGAFLGKAGNPLIKYINHQRDEAEILLAQMARQRGMPILGICRGCQVLNVAAGGSLVIDIPTEYKDALKHDPKKDATAVSHPVNLEKGTLLASIYNSVQLTVNSYHHQAVKMSGEGLVISAIAPDGVIEGIEASDHPFYLGVQWHPERANGNQANIKLVFDAFIKAAQEYRSL